MVVPDSVTTLGARAFESCSSLASLVVGKGVDSIPGLFVMRCPLLTDIVVLGTIQAFDPTAFDSADASGMVVRVSTKAQQTLWTEANDANGFGLDPANIVVAGELCTVRFEPSNGGSLLSSALSRRERLSPSLQRRHGTALDLPDGMFKIFPVPVGVSLPP